MGEIKYINHGIVFVNDSCGNFSMAKIAYFFFAAPKQQQKSRAPIGPTAAKVIKQFSFFVHLLVHALSQHVHNQIQLASEF